MPLTVQDTRKIILLSTAPACVCLPEQSETQAYERAQCSTILKFLFHWRETTVQQVRYWLYSLIQRPEFSWENPSHVKIQSGDETMDYRIAGNFRDFRDPRLKRENKNCEITARI